MDIKEMILIKYFLFGFMSLFCLELAVGAEQSGKLENWNKMVQSIQESNWPQALFEIQNLDQKQILSFELAQSKKYIYDKLSTQPYSKSLGIKLLQKIPWAIFGLLALLGVCVFYVFSLKNQKFSPKKAALVLGGYFTLLGAVLFFKVQIQSSIWGIVKSESYVRSGPDENLSVWANLPLGSEVQLLKSNPGASWLYVQAWTPESVRGWVEKDKLLFDGFHLSP